MATFLSLCMIVKNEEQNLPRCLDSVRDVADEIVVVDTGSTDRTVDIAAAYGARVFHHAWQNDFAEARNVSLDQATGKWILIMDADEEMEPASRARCQAALAQASTDSLFVVVRSFLPPGSALAFDDFLQVRFFRCRPEFRYENNVHEQITPAILGAGATLGLVDLRIWHHGYAQKDVQRDANRDQRNIELLEQVVAREPQHAFFCAKLGLQYYEAGNLVLAEAYLRRVLTLNYQELPVFVFQDVLAALGFMALDRQEYDRVIRYASTNIDCLGQGSRALIALHQLADAQMGLGLQALNALLSEGPHAIEGQPVQALRERFDLARTYLQRLCEQPGLTAGGRRSAEARLAQCAAALEKLPLPTLREASTPTAAATLQALLEADDLPAALQAHAEQLNPDLLALVQRQAETARQAGEQELAEGLETLAAHVAQLATQPMATRIPG
jgi:glycosyltransferase involved in cell wall biosynthesis